MSRFGARFVARTFDTGRDGRPIGDTMKAFNADATLERVTYVSVDENHERCRRCEARWSMPFSGQIGEALGVTGRQLLTWLDEREITSAKIKTPGDAVTLRFSTEDGEHRISPVVIKRADASIGRKEDDEPEISLLCTFGWGDKDPLALARCSGQSVALFIEPVQAELKLAGAA